MPASSDGEVSSNDTCKCIPSPRKGVVSNSSGEGVPGLKSGYVPDLTYGYMYDFSDESVPGPIDKGEPGANNGDVPGPWNGRMPGSRDEDLQTSYGDGLPGADNTDVLHVGPRHATVQGSSNENSQQVRNEVTSGIASVKNPLSRNKSFNYFFFVMSGLYDFLS